MADSFYAGQAGLSFVLKGYFESIDDMVAAFKRGDSYKEVWYHEFCLVSTKNLNDKDNGKLYQRGLDYTNEMGGAVYKGQIVGSSSGTPFMQLNTIKEATDRSTEAIPDDWYRVYPTAYDTDEEGHVNGYLTNIDEGQSGKPIATFPFSKAHDTSLVPGKEEDGTFNDEILWTWINVRRPENNSQNWYYIGLELPYLVSEYTAHTVSQYNESGNFVESTSTATRTDDKSHPFFMSWDFGIPKGIKGDAIRNLRVITPKASDTIYAASAITVDEDSGLVMVGEPGYDGQDDDVAQGRTILVFDMYYYDNQINPDPITIYVGDFNKIDNIILADDGTLTIDYSHDNNTVFSRKIRWITSTTLAPDTGVFTVTYNNGDPAFTTTLDWIKQIKLDADGTVHYIHTKDNRDESYANVVKWVTDVTLNPNTGVFQMNFNYGSPLTRQLDWVDDIYIDEDTGEITIHHVNSAVGENGEVTLPARLKLITNATISADGIVTMYTNTGESFNLKQTGTQTDFRIKTIDNVILNTGINDDKHIFIKYNTERTNTPIGDPINFISDVIVRQSDYHLLVLFTDPDHRATAEDLDESGRDANGHYWVQSVEGSNGQTTPAGVYWRDYGTVKDQAGILVGLNLDNETISAAGYANDPIGYLNAFYPNGLTGGSIDQKVVTYAPNQTDSKEFYAYDYGGVDSNSVGWFYLGTISDTGSRDVMLVTQGQYTSETLRNLNSNGLLFKIMNSTGLKTTPMPKYWDRAYTGWQ